MVTLAMTCEWTELAGAVARIAGILHLASNVDRPDPWGVEIAAEVMAGAVRLADYLIAHAKAAFAEMGADPTFDGARCIIDWIKRKALTHFTKRDAHYALQGRFKRAKELDAPLAVLIERGFIREQSAERLGPGRKPSQVFEVNPHLTKLIQSTQFAPKSDSVNSVNCVTLRLAPRCKEVAATSEDIDFEEGEL
ncbi:MAG: DUF3987 domain-containing protein [Bacillota bacterium]|nr:DUF3987 domain-containing protein [Bacillota bacterium]